MKTKQNKKEAKGIKGMASWVYKKFCSALFPSRIKCLICGEDLPQIQDIEFCDRCDSLINYITEEHACQKCGSKITGQGKFCLNCMNTKRAFSMARSVAEFDGVAQKLVHNFKFNAKPYISATMGKLMANKFLETKWEVDFISYVPPSGTRFSPPNECLLLGSSSSLQFLPTICDNQYNNYLTKSL